MFAVVNQARDPAIPLPAVDFYFLAKQKGKYKEPTGIYVEKIGQSKDILDKKTKGQAMANKNKRKSCAITRKYYEGRCWA